MNKIFSVSLLAVAAFALTGCDSLLDDNRYPETTIVDNEEFWGNPTNCELELNQFFDSFYAYGNGGGTGSYYFSTLSDDQCGNQFRDWNNTSIPSGSTLYTSPYTKVRALNIIINNVTANKTLNETNKTNFLATARMLRGYYYYQLVKYYGDVPLIEGVLDVTSPEIYTPRTPRKEVENYILADLEYAAKNITLQNGKQKYTKDLAKAILSEYCLYVGTFWKYCTEKDNYYAPDDARSKQFLNLCVTYTADLVAAYPIGADLASYRALYQSAWSASASEGITGLMNNAEVIFACQYEKDKFGHSTQDYTCSSTTQSGLSKDAFDAYLFKDGKPLALTSEDTNDAGEFVETMKGADMIEVEDPADPTKKIKVTGPGVLIKDLLAVRDGRLSMTVDTVVYYKGMSWSRAGSMQSTSSSGYGISKYDNVNMPVNYRSTAAKNYTCAPLYWGAYMALNLAEAKAELGTLTDADLNITLNKLYKRAGLPDQTVASLSAMNDPANNMGISSLLWEVRRCRRCELIMDLGLRYWDLVRWHQLELLDSSKHPNILLGANVKNVPEKFAPEQVTGDYVNASFGKTRIYDNRQYEYPIPSGQITLNEAITQQPNWK